MEGGQSPTFRRQVRRNKLLTRGIIAVVVGAVSSFDCNSLQNNNSSQNSPVVQPPVVPVSPVVPTNNNDDKTNAKQRQTLVTKHPVDDCVTP
jgi:hypothetical protein